MKIPRSLPLPLGSKRDLPYHPYLWTSFSAAWHVLASGGADAEVPVGDYELPIGQAEVVQKGTDVTRQRSKEWPKESLSKRNQIENS